MEESLKAEQDRLKAFLMEEPDLREGKPNRAQRRRQKYSKASKRWERRALAFAARYERDRGVRPS